ncbi:hypothetical protein E2C01_088075 [Portunus trituberculatus]|uniref:Uncharacterized protein n=1 Tax=Portunus trituberculatus TaxID=210409 RepID=A0A5B7J886_PORTR|nr:hypothetical protein [Portunus trituberculatus]
MVVGATLTLTRAPCSDTALTVTAVVSIFCAHEQKSKQHSEFVSVLNQSFELTCGFHTPQALGYICAVMFGCSGAITYLALVQHQERSTIKVSQEHKDDGHIATLAGIF